MNLMENRYLYKLICANTDIHYCIDVTNKRSGVVTRLAALIAWRR